jgi:hypothetical protein
MRYILVKYDILCWPTHYKMRARGSDFTKCGYILVKYESLWPRTIIKNALSGSYFNKIHIYLWPRTDKMRWVGPCLIKCVIFVTASRWNALRRDPYFHTMRYICDRTLYMRWEVRPTIKGASCSVRIGSILITGAARSEKIYVINARAGPILLNAIYLWPSAHYKMR